MLSVFEKACNDDNRVILLYGENIIISEIYGQVIIIKIYRMTDPKSWVVHKFGGTSVGNADCMRKCIDIIRPLLNVSRVAVVVSAMGGKPKVTDLLLDMVHAAANHEFSVVDRNKEAIYSKHKTCIEDILGNIQAADANSPAKRILSLIENDLKDISDLLRAVALMRTPHEQILELVSGYGEVWSASLITEVMRQQGLPFVFVNARDVLFVSEDALGTSVHWDVSEQKLLDFIAAEEKKMAETSFGIESSQKYAPVPVPFLLITGYIASTVSGVATTLKRDGSDFSASIFGKLLKATSITIWTDVSGVYSADPRRVAEAQIIPEVSYHEAIELAYFGAKVIHPKTMAPAIMNQIPIYIRNTFDAENKGTRIFLSSQKASNKRDRFVCGFTSVDNIALLNIEGTGMIGVPGIAHRLFGALKNANISVMYIAQASSEYSICVAIKSAFVDAAKSAVAEAFFYELKQGMISDIRVVRDCAIIAAVGEAMSNTAGVSGIFFGALGRASVNILSISQGCDERNISAVVYASDATKALRAVHSAFWLSSLDLSIGIVGVGRVGSALIVTLLEQLELIKKHYGINIKIRGICNSTKMMLNDDLVDDLKAVIEDNSPSPSSPSARERRSQSMSAFGMNGTHFRRSRSQNTLEDIRQVIMSAASEKKPANMKQLFEHVRSGTTPHSLIIDCTPSMEVASLHADWLRGSVHVVTANKRAISSSLEMYNNLLSAMNESNKLYMSEVTIGASLPIRTTLQDVLSSGDAVFSIVGMLSVSVGVVLTEVCENGLKFSEALSKTHATGLFEDDAFVDLEGTEAAQKVLVLARALGIALSIEDIDIEPLVKRREIASWVDTTADLAVEDELMASRAAAAKAKGCTLRYIQRIVCNEPAELGVYTDTSTVKASVRLEEVPLDSQYAMVKGAVYYFAFHTARYSQTPLVIQVMFIP
jgi:bifunctional aspartokinase / homoserine dehydrogenase 1